VCSIDWFPGVRGGVAPDPGREQGQTGELMCSFLWGEKVFLSLFLSRGQACRLVLFFFVCEGPVRV